ncbi:MAG: tryptophan--tRNA ligase [Dehalococcoidia bacterium]|nr:MAG: tryptophan--tRNA ligase [Dehalococcoidia bacterium]
MEKGRIFSGARPTGRQHIGNYLGALQNWVKLQNEYDCIYCIVDIHALTSLEDTSDLQSNIHEMILDWLAVGLDPKKSILFVQSQVPEVMELHTLLSMITPLSWLLRVPTFKEKITLQPENVNYGLVGYPVLMTSDIVLYKATVVPVGEDQLPHLELAREIARRFNNLFGYTFPEPKGKLTNYPLVLGLDGKEKMSKQAGNDIELALSAEETIEKIKTAYTDPARRFRSDPGRPEKCNIYKLMYYFDSISISGIAEKCKEATIGCVECKMILAEGINRVLKPVRDKRAELANNPEYITGVLSDGADRAQVIARETLIEVKNHMKLI